MSFNNIETSVDQGEPIELYKFTYGDQPDQVYGYTDGEQPVVFNTIEYRPIPIQRGQISISGTLDKAALTVKLPGSSEIPEMFRVYSPSTVINLEIYQGHANDPDKQFLLCWSGRVLNCRWVKREASLTCEPITTSLKRPGLRRNYQYGCPHVLYDPTSCRASKAAATVEATVQAIDGTLVSLSVAGNEDYEGGVVEWRQPNGRREIRTVVRVISGAYLLSGSPIGLMGGMKVNLSKGCDHSLAGCAKHDNIPNFGGFPWIPLKNPMSNSSPFK